MIYEEENRMKCLYELNVEQLYKVVEEDLSLDGWIIWNESLAKRTESARELKRFDTIKDKAIEKGFTNIDNEIVTWFDTLTMLYRSLKNISDLELKDNLKIFQEFRMPYSRKRADYVLVYDNKILILEFSFDKLGYAQKYEDKLQQASSYKEILGVFLPKEIDIGTYTFLIAPDEDKEGRLIYDSETNRRVNDDKVEELATVIVKFFKKNLKSAYNALKHLDYGDGEN